jgi:tetratricopeptide (TPR) repeat protein
MSDETAVREDWRAAARAATGSDPTAVHAYYERLIPRLPAADQIDALLEWGGAEQRAGQWREAETHYRQALALAERGDDRAGQARSGATLARLLENTGDFDQALAILAAARDDFAALGDQASVQQVLGRMARAYISQGNFAAARACCEQKLEIAAALHLPREVAQARYQMGTIYTQQGAYDEALACFEQSFQQAIADNNRGDIALIKDHMGLIYTSQGNYPQALACYQAALEIATSLGKRHNASHIAGHIGQIYLHNGDFAAAQACFTVLLQTARELQDRPGMSVALALLADTAMHQEQYAEAEVLAQEALALGRSMSLSYLPGYLCALAALYQRQGRYAAAQPLVAEALARARESGSQAFAFEARILDLRGRAALGEMDAETARAALEELLAGAQSAQEQAIAHYEIWHLDRTQEAHRQAAIHLYRQLYRETPELDERQRIEELTGTPLPAPPPLPALPAGLLPTLVSLDSAPAQADRPAAPPAPTSQEPA